MYVCIKEDGGLIWLIKTDLGEKEKNHGMSVVTVVSMKHNMRHD
jgi:hypothetical protein